MKTQTEGCTVAGILWFGFGQWDRSVLLFGIRPYIKHCKLWRITLHISVTIHDKSNLWKENFALFQSLWVQSTMAGR